MRITTRKGDDGTTGMFHGGRVRKDDLGPEACGAVDEAVSALGLARSLASGELAERILEIQRGLFVVGAELATAPEKRDKLEPDVSLVTSEMVERLERLIDAIEAGGGLPAEFVVPGEAELPAALDLARSVIRRAERRAVSLSADGRLEGTEAIRHLNRLSDYIYVLARSQESTWEPSRERGTA